MIRIKEHLRFWEFHDLIFHLNSRQGRFDYKVHFGATFRFQYELDHQQNFKNIDFDEPIELCKLNSNELEIDDVPFSTVLENLRSIRNYNISKKIKKNDLGQFLYRSIGLRETVKIPDQDALFNPFPSAWAIHEIDFYLLDFLQKSS